MKALRSASTMLCASLFACLPTWATDPPPTVSEGERGFDAQEGPGLYRSICQGCHMPDGRGAQGAGVYPALAGNPRLASAPFVMLTVLNGRKAMPPIGRMLSDAQVAAVTNYVRTQLGQNHPGPVTAADVKALR